MNLFDRLPSTLFNPLASPSAPVYAEVLLRLFAETQRHQQPLSRDLAVDIVVDILGEASATDTSDLLLDTADGASGDIGFDDLAARAAGILRYLSSCGWLRVESQSDFSLAYILPAHSFRLLNVLYELAANEPPRLQGMICAIHDLLQAARQESGDYVRLREAHYQTRYLLQSLKELQHNIGEHIQQVLEQLQARDILEQVFVRYREQIVDRAYHQLRTTDHVSRFRPGILDALVSLDDPQQVELLAQQMRIRGEAESVEEAAVLLDQSINEIRDHFEFLDRLLATIDVRHSQFVDSAVRSVEHQLTADTTISGRLYMILTHLLTEESGPVGQPLAEVYDPLTSLFALDLLDSQSLAPPTRAAVPFMPEPAAVPVPSEAEVAAAHARTLQQMNRAVSRERVRRYVEHLLRDRNELPAAEIPLSEPDDLPLLIYMRAYGDGSLGYRVEEQPDGGWIEHDQIGFRAFVLRRV